MCGCVWEKKGLTCYQSDAKCIRAGEYINAGRTLQHKPLSTTEASGVDECGGLLLKSGAIRSILETDGQKSESYRRGLVPRRKNCPCDLVIMGCANADITDGTARTSIVRHSLMPMIPS